MEKQDQEIKADVMDGYRALGYAVVKLACQDYMKALKTLANNPENKGAFWRKNECESFFHNDMSLYCDIAPEYLIEECRKKVERQIAKREEERE